jgi:50S ribosomal subunit-associated GTPase HflX
VHADLLLIVLDVSDPAAEMHYDTVTRTLDELTLKGGGRGAGSAGQDGGGSSDESGPPRLLLLNKSDRLNDNRSVLVWQRKSPGAVAISAIDPGGPGYAELTQAVRAAAQGGVMEVTLRLAMSDAKAVNVVENRAEVLGREYQDGHALLRVRIGRRQLDQLRSVTGRAVEVIED